MRVPMAAAPAALALSLFFPADQVVADHWHERSIECEQALALRDFAKDAIPQLEAAGVSARNWRHVQRLAKLQTARACAPWLHVEKKPAAAVRKPIDQDWLDDVLAGLDEPPATPPAVAMNAADMARSACESPTGYPSIEDGISHAILVWCDSASESESIAAPAPESPPPEPAEPAASPMEGRHERR